MVTIILFTLLGIVALGAAVLANIPKAGRLALLVLAPFLVIFGAIIGSSVVIDNNEVGILVKQVGAALPTGQIIARNGEMGTQADIIGPGWHFGYWPFIYDVHKDSVFTVKPGEFGFVTARDGLPLPEGELFAPPWESAQDMLNPVVFLQKGGRRGPQTTILTPGTYRFNTALHEVTAMPALQVDAGSVAVIKSNSGKEWAQGAEKVDMVNGVPLVPKGCRGVWAVPLTPGGYYLNTRAYSPVLVKTTQRVYTYQAAMSSPKAKANQNKTDSTEDWGITVRSKDGFSFPVDVRVVCAVEASNTPYLVALLGTPDQIVNDEQEGEQLEILEARVILPVVRAILRNVAETMNALEFVNRRSEIEAIAAKTVKLELAKSRVTMDGVYVGNIHLDSTTAGMKLLTTQTDREVAVNQEKLFEQQKLAEEARAHFVRAQEEAEQQRQLAQAEYNVKIQKSAAEARAILAKGEADYQLITGEGRAKAYKMMVEALGRDQVAQIELLKLVVEGKVQITPQVMVTGGEHGGAMDALTGTMLRQALTPPAKETK